MKSLLANEVAKFDQRYSMHSNSIVADAEKPSVPSFSPVYEQIKVWTTSAKMESEIPVIALVYIEKLVKKARVLINEHNWKRIVMITL